MDLSQMGRFRRNRGCDVEALYLKRVARLPAMTLSVTDEKRMMSKVDGYGALQVEYRATEPPRLGNQSTGL